MRNQPPRQRGNKRKAYDNIAFGRQPVIELLQAARPIDKILIQQGAHGEAVQTIRHLAKVMEVPVKTVPEEKLKSITGGIHQGVVAFTSPVAFQRIETLLPFIIETGATPLLFVLDGITDVRNFGAIARTAYASGVHALIIPYSDTAPVNAESVKASAGALYQIPVCREKNLEAVADFLELNGIALIGTDAKAKQRVYDLDLTAPLAFVMGSEDTGIRHVLRKRLTHTASIPVMHSFDSYNVSVAAGIVLYECMRQRQTT